MTKIVIMPINESDVSKTINWVIIKICRLMRKFQFKGKKIIGGGGGYTVPLDFRKLKL